MAMLTVYGYFNPTLTRSFTEVKIINFLLKQLGCPKLILFHLGLRSMP